jgi:hypothetical protein
VSFGNDFSDVQQLPIIPDVDDWSASLLNKCLICATFCVSLSAQSVEWMARRRCDAKS